MQANTAPKVVASLEGAAKSYGSGDNMVQALKPTNLEVKAGELLIILGPSGSGKTTILSLLGCVIYPTAGRVKVDDTYTDTLNEKKLANLRLQKLGFIFQSFNLVAPITVLQNVMLPMRLLGVSLKEAEQRALEKLEIVGLAEKRKKLPKELSGGQQQRVAVARALVTNPPLMLCDEPTASLDVKSAELVMNELKAIAKRGQAVAVVTHDLRLRQYADRTLYVSDGNASFEPFSEEFGH
jgi:putative ABC transport system ATP-binding protein